MFLLALSKCTKNGTFSNTAPSLFKQFVLNIAQALYFESMFSCEKSATVVENDMHILHAIVISDAIHIHNSTCYVYPLSV
jgi:hypothetical protein